MQLLNNRGIEFVVQSVVHALIVTLVVEALTRSWEIRQPGARIRIRLLVLVLPLVGWPLYQLLYPDRGTPAFREDFALIDLNGWLSLELGHGPLFYFVAAILPLAGALFITQELLPALRQQLLSLGSLKPGENAPVRLGRALAAVAQRAGGPGMQAFILSKAEPVAYTAGLWKQRLEVSPPLVELLDDEELEAVLAHEWAHRVRRDNLAG